MADQKTVIEIRDAVFAYEGAEHNAVDGVSLCVYEGEFLVLLGESGCGKSTLLNIIGGMDQLTSGSLFFEGRDYSQADDKLLTEYNHTVAQLLITAPARRPASWARAWRALPR